MGFSYTVRPGDYLSKIAAAFGFLSPRTIWDDSANTSLRKLRTDPEVLLPGDVLFIPDKESRVEAGATEKKHTFFLQRPKLRLRVAIRDRLDAAQSGKAIAFDVEGNAATPTTDAEGIVDREITASSANGSLTALGETLPMEIGFLNPVEHPSGWRARLNNLGYMAGIAGSNATASEQERSAVEEFQCDFGLVVTGVVDEITQQKLLDVHGV